MRYRQKVKPVEYLVAIFPLMDGYHRLSRHHAPLFHGNTIDWHAVPDYFFTVLLFTASLLTVLRHFTIYVDLTSTTLEYRNLWRHKSLYYGEIEYIVPPPAFDSNIIKIYSAGRKLTFAVDHTADFIDELKLYAPQARLEAPRT
jgi:hypothetical protein